MQEKGGAESVTGLASRPAARADLYTADVDGELLIFDEALGVWHLLNPTARAVFLVCDGSGTIQELAADLAFAYDVDPAALQPDVVSFVEELERKNLLVRREHAESANPGHQHVHVPHGSTEDSSQASNEAADSYASARPRFLSVPPST